MMQRYNVVDDEVIEAEDGMYIMVGDAVKRCTELEEMLWAMARQFRHVQALLQLSDCKYAKEAHQCVSNTLGDRKKGTAPSFVWSWNL